MAWWDDAAEAVGSAVGWLGDAAEAVVDTATEVTEEVTESASDAADAGLDALRDGAASVGPALGAVANVVLGVVKGALHAVADLAATTFDVVRNVGKLLSDILHLNLADIIADLGNIGINILQLLVWGVRLVTGAYFGMRDRALTFIRNLIIDEFGNKDGEDILRKLGSGSLHFGLPIAASTRIMAADSNTFPFVTLHNAGVIDLFALAGLLSFNSFRIARERTRVVRVNAAGGNVLFPPISRFAIRSFLNSGGTTMRIRAFAMTPYAAARAMRAAFRKFQEAVHRHHLDSIIQFSELPGIPDTSLPERERFLLLCGQRWKRLLVVRRDHAAQRATGSRWNSALHRHLWLCGREKWPHQWPHHQARVERLPHLRRDQHDRRLHYRYCSAHA